MTAPLRVLTWEDLDTGIWVAFCLDLRFGAQAPALEGIPEVIRKGIGMHRRLAQLRGREPFEGPLYPPFQDLYLTVFDRAPVWQTVRSDPALEIRVADPTLGQ